MEHLDVIELENPERLKFTGFVTWNKAYLGQDRTYSKRVN